MSEQKRYVLYFMITDHHNDGYDLYVMDAEQWDSWGRDMDGVEICQYITVDAPPAAWLAQSGLAACDKAREEAAAKYQTTLAKIKDQESKYLALCVDNQPV